MGMLGVATKPGHRVKPQQRLVLALHANQIVRVIIRLDELPSQPFGCCGKPACVVINDKLILRAVRGLHRMNVHRAHEERDVITIGKLAVGKCVRYGKHG